MRSAPPVPDDESETTTEARLPRFGRSAALARAPAPHRPVDGSIFAPKPTFGLAADTPRVALQRKPLRRLVVLDPLYLFDGVLHLRLGDGVGCPLRYGDPRGLHPGWSAKALYVGCDNMLWLSLSHESGATGDWFLADDATYLATEVHSLPDAARAGLLRHVRDLLATPAGPTRDDALTAYGRMHPATRDVIAAYLAAEDWRLAALEPDSSPAPATMLPPPGAHLLTSRRWNAGDPAPPGAIGGSLWSDRGCLVLPVGASGSVTLPLPYRPTHARLSLEVRGTAISQPLVVSIDGWAVGRTRIGPEKIHGSRLDYWIPAEALPDLGPVLLELSSPGLQPGGAGTAVGIDAISLDLGPAMPDVASPTNGAALMAMFESLGEDCEFGFVQRHFGAEPLGLFRFAGSWQMRNMLRLLETDLEGIGDPGSLTTTVGEAIIRRPGLPPRMVPEFMMVDEKQRFWYHTFLGPDHQPEAEAIIANEQKLRYLRRKLIEDLEDGEKIWLVKDCSRGDINEAFAIVDVLGRKAPNKVLWVTRTVDGRPAGSVEWIAPNLLRGYSGAPHLDPQIFDADEWFRLCSKAQRAFAERHTLNAASRVAGA